MSIAPSGPATGGAGDQGFSRDQEPAVGDREGEVYRRVQGSPEFQELRRGYRRFAFPLTGAFLAWYLFCLLLSTASPTLMAHKVVGHVNVALVIGLAQFASTFAVCLLVARTWASRRDAKALELRWRAQEELR